MALAAAPQTVRGVIIRACESTPPALVGSLLRSGIRVGLCPTSSSVAEDLQDRVRRWRADAQVAPPPLVEPLFASHVLPADHTQWTPAIRALSGALRVAPATILAVDDAAREESSGAFREAVHAAGLGEPQDSEPALSSSSLLHSRLVRSRRALESDVFAFGPHDVFGAQIFAASHLAVAFVNLRPVLPGHVLVCSRRPVPRVADLAPDELRALWDLGARVGRLLTAEYGADALTWSIQDGSAAGQTVPHVHLHVLPRRRHDLPRGDDIWDELDRSEREAAAAMARRGETGVVEEDGGASPESGTSLDRGGGVFRAEGAPQRASEFAAEPAVRSPATMAAEATRYRAWLRANEGAAGAPREDVVDEGKWWTGPVE